MRNIFSVVSVLLLVACGQREAASPAPSGPVAWQSNYQEAVSKAKAEKKIVMVDLYTDWCGWCKRLDRDVYADSAVAAKLSSGFVSVKLNPEKSKEAATTAGAAVTDGWITTKVQAKFADEPVLEGSDINVDTHDHVVTLMGTVRSGEAYAFHAEFVDRSPDLYQPETLARLRADADVKTPAYIRARREVDVIRRSSGEAFATVDVIVTPTVAVPPSLLADIGDDVRASMAVTTRTTRNTAPFNLYGWPAISVPCGFTREGLPIGLQIAGPPGADATVLRLAHAYEQATTWHTRHPR